MPLRASSAWVTAVLISAMGCGDPAGPGPEPLRTVLVHRQDTGENVLLNTDGSEAGAYAPGGTGLIPLGAIGGGPTLVLLHGNAIVMGTLGQAGLDTLIRPAPQSSSLAGISDDGQLVAVVSYAPTPALLVHGLVAGVTDTLDYGPDAPVLPPVISPDGRRIALFGLTTLSFTITLIELGDPPRSSTRSASVSRFTNRPLFGWPRWVGDRIYLAFLRENDSGLDTLLVGSVDPDNPGALMEEEYRVAMGLEGEAPAELVLGDPSSYAMSPDAQALVLGAYPVRGAARHSIYLMSPVTPHARLVRDEPGEFLVFPLFVSR